jgi:hypothetical protein
VKAILLDGNFLSNIKLTSHGLLKEIITPNDRAKMTSSINHVYRNSECLSRKLYECENTNAKAVMTIVG